MPTTLTVGNGKQLSVFSLLYFLNFPFIWMIPQYTTEMKFHLKFHVLKQSFETLKSTIFYNEAFAASRQITRQTCVYSTPAVRDLVLHKTVYHVVIISFTYTAPKISACSVSCIHCSLVHTRPLFHVLVTSVKHAKYTVKSFLFITHLISCISWVWHSKKI